MRPNTSLLMGGLFVLAAGFASRADVYKGFTGFIYQTMNYRLFIPADYSASTRYPMVIFLHGIGEVGTNNTAQLDANIGATSWATAAHQAQCPSFVLAPQAPSGSWYYNRTNTTLYDVDRYAPTANQVMLLAIIDTLIKHYSIDTNRLYLTGFSNGGIGTWDFNLRYPAR